MASGRGDDGQNPHERPGRFFECVYLCGNHPLRSPPAKAELRKICVYRCFYHITVFVPVGMRWILSRPARVKVNGRIVKEPSTPVEGSEEITVDDQKIGAKEYTYVMLNKPAGYTTTKDDMHADKTVMDLLPSSMRHLAPVGRLDRDSEGLLLLTNDGDLALSFDPS